MKPSILLLSAPYTDYTQPYHSLSYISAPLKKAGYQVDVLDLNIEWFRWLFKKEQLQQWDKELVTEFEQLTRQSHWDIDTQIETTKIIQAMAIVRSIDPEQAVKTFQSEAFYDYKEYIKAQNCVTSFELVLEHFYKFYPFSLAFRKPVGEPNMSELMAGINNSERFVADIRQVLTHYCKDKDYLFCGMSIPFYGNTRMSFAALKAVRQLFPQTTVVAGGTATTDMFKNRLSNDTLKPLAEVCDYLLPGEADNTIVELADWLENRNKLIPNGLYELKSGKVLSEQYIIKPEPLSNSNDQANTRITPDYSWIRWNAYLSPVKQVNYSPTRGCFWNKCTFCDYGLNDDLPTAPYRAADIAQVADDFEQLTSEGIDHIYLAVDSVTPGFLKQLAQAILDRNIKVHWSAEFFLTPQFNIELIKLLEASGLVTASCGYESGSSHVLELMGKGKQRVERVYRPVFDAFTEANIGLQPKYFFGFPGESEEDREQTVALLLEYKEIFPVLTRGNIFDLTEGSIVAKQPEKYGVKNIHRKAEFDLNSACDYEHTDGTPVCIESDIEALNMRVGYFDTFERPWCGGIDTFHSKLYLERYGRNVFADIQARFSNQLNIIKPERQIAVRCLFDLEDVFENVMMYAVLQSSCSVGKLQAQMNAREIQDALEEITEAVLPEEEEDIYTLTIR